MSNNTGRRTEAHGPSAARVAADRAKRVLSVLFATFAAIALIAGVAVSGFSTPKAEAQECTIANPQTFTGAVTAASPTGTNPQHQIDLVFPQAAYVNSVTINSRVKLGNENFGKWRITLGGKTLTSGDGVRVSYTSGKPGSVVFDFDTPIQVGANSKGNAAITLFGQSGAATNYSMTYTGSIEDPCPAPAPTTSEAPSSQPTSAEPTPETSAPEPQPTSDQPSPEPTSASTPEPTSQQPSTEPTGTPTEPLPTAPGEQGEAARGRCETRDDLLAREQVTVRNGSDIEHNLTRQIELNSARDLLLESLTVDLHDTNNTFYYSTVTGSDAGFNNIKLTVIDGTGSRVFTMPADMIPQGTFSKVGTTQHTQQLTLHFGIPVDVAKGAKVVVSFLPGSTGGRVTDLSRSQVSVSASGLQCVDENGNSVPVGGNRTQPKEPVKGPPRDPNEVVEISEDGGPEEFATVRVHARAFNDHVHSETDSAITSTDFRFTEGAVFGLHLGKANNSTSEGPGDPIRGQDGKQLTCTIGKDGYCDITIRVKNGKQNTQWYGKRVWVVQQKASEGAYWENEIKTGSYENPQTTTWTIGYTDKLRGGKVFYPSLTGTDQTRSFGAAVQALNNPELPATCNPGPKIAFVMDVSGSVRGAEVATYRDALTGNGGVIDQLAGTNASISAYTFNWGSPSVNTAAIGNYTEPINVDTQLQEAKAVINNRLGKDDNILGRTNWNSGLEAAYQGGKEIFDPTRPDSKKYDIVVFITDGNPNTTGRDRYRPDGNDVSLRALEGGVYAANKIKAEGTRVVAVAAGKPGQNTPENLRLISGPKEGKDYFIGEWSALAQNLGSIVRAVSCQSNVSVTKLIKNGNDDSNLTPGAGWNFTAQRGATSINPSDAITLVNSSNRSPESVGRGSQVSDKTDADGYAIWGVNFNTDDQSAKAEIKLSEVVEDGYRFEQAKCTHYQLSEGKKIRTGKTASFSKEQFPNGAISLSGDNRIGVREQWDCEFINEKIDKPSVEVVKRVDSAQQQADGTWKVQYTVTVSNTGSTATKYTLDDELRYGKGLTPSSASYQINSGQSTQWEDVTKRQNFVRDREIKAGGKDKFTVTVIAKIGEGSAIPTDWQLSCRGATGNEEPGGFLNTAHLTRADGSTQSSSACDEPALPEIEKQAVDTVSGPDNEGLYTAKYNVTVRNRSDVNRKQGKAIYYSLTDTPAFVTGADPQKWSLSTVNFSNSNPNKRTSFEVSPSAGTTFPIQIVSSDKARKLEAGKSDQYTVSVKFKLGEVDEKAAQCSADGAGHGLFNTARVTSGDQYREDDGCHNVPKQPTFRIGIEKWGAENGQPVNLGDPGTPGSYGFTITDPAGTVSALTKFERSDRGGYVTSDLDLKVGRIYTLTETKAPNGYALLAEPVVFQINNKGGQFVLDIKSGASMNVQTLPVDGKTISNLRIIQVTDVHQGNLPRSGGVGVGALAGLAGLIVAIGCVMLRRRTV